MANKNTGYPALSAEQDWQGENLSSQAVAQLSHDNWPDSLLGKLASIQNSLNKLGLRKERYAQTIRQALRDGRLNEAKINQNLSTNLNHLRERLAARGLGLGGAQALAGEELEREAAQARRVGMHKTQDTVTNSRSRLKELDGETREQLAAVAQAVEQATTKKKG